jgi:hypothetical protein
MLPPENAQAFSCKVSQTVSTTLLREGRATIVDAKPHCEWWPLNRQIMFEALTPQSIEDSATASPSAS